MSNRAARTRRGSTILTRSPTGPLQARTSISATVRAKASGSGARPSSAARSASAVAIAPPARASSSEPARAPIVAASLPTSAASSRGLPAASRIPATSAGASPCFSSHSCRAAVAVRTRLRRSRRSNQLTRPGATPEGPRSQRIRSLARPVPSTASSRAISAPPTAVAGIGDLRVERGRNAVGLEHRGDQRAAPARVAHDHRDLFRVGTRREQASDLRRDRLGLAALPGRAQEDEALVRRALHRLARAEPALEVEEERRLGVGGVGRGLLHRVEPDLLERSEQRRVPLLEHPVAALERQRYGHLDRRHQRSDQVQLVARQVVEPVEEDGSPPEAGVGAQQLDRLARDDVGIHGPEPVAHPRVAGEEGGDVAHIGRPLERARRRFDVRRLEARTLQLVEQACQRRGEAGVPAGAAQRTHPFPPVVRGSRDGAEPLRRREDPAGRRAAAGCHRVEQAVEGHHVGAEDGPVCAELPLEGVDVVAGRDDEDRVALEHRDQPAPDAAGAARVGWSVDQLQRHGGLSSIGLPAAPPNPQRRRKRAPLCRPPPPLD